MATGSNSGMFHYEENPDDIAASVYDVIRDIKDPEKPETLEELDVVSEEGVGVKPLNGTATYMIDVEFVPTVPHCSLATLIGLCIRIKLRRNLPQKFKLDIHIKKGTHDTGEEINKQINDKERVAAAMENPNLQKLVDSCIGNNDS